MVALKPYSDSVGCCDSDSGKQERRGGIETLPGIPDGPLGDGEAGTPWWH